MHGFQLLRESFAHLYGVNRKSVRLCGGANEKERTVIGNVRPIERSADFPGRAEYVSDQSFAENLRCLRDRIGRRRRNGGESSQRRRAERGKALGRAAGLFGKRLQEADVAVRFAASWSGCWRAGQRKFQRISGAQRRLANRRRTLYFGRRSKFPVVPFAHPRRTDQSLGANRAAFCSRGFSIKDARRIGRRLAHHL